ncbi:MAG: HDOD domain-containing protein [Deltaproteobacteria bacterium]|nr:HDOD domain-containing protein [Deltaproteobacteria bacterium]
MKPDFFQQIDRIRELPTLPVIVLKVNQMLQNLETTADQLSRVIETDQAMAVKILKLVNSSFYGFQSKISSINSAVIILGFNTIQHAVVSLSVMKSFSLKKNLKRLNIQDFWHHSLAVAVISKYLADHADKTLSSDCFTAGLLHDIGKLILAEYFPEEFEKIWLRTVESGISFVDAEKMENDVNHAEIGAYLAEKWLLPQPLVDAIRHHHSAFSNNHLTSAIIGIADLLVNTCQPSPEGRFEQPPGLLDAPTFLQPLLQTLPEWYPRLQGEIASACQFFMESQNK